MSGLQRPGGAPPLDPQANEDANPSGAQPTKVEEGLEGKHAGRRSRSRSGLVFTLSQEGNSMSKRKFVRIAAVLTTLAATMALISAAVMSTGAYFTDSHPGRIQGTNGNVAITVTGSGDTSVNTPSLVRFDFSGILPGQVKTATVDVTNTTTNSEDVWLVFDNSNYMWSAVNDLGQYGKFQVGSYVYDNLNNNNAYGMPANPGVAGTPTGDYMSGSCSTVPRVPGNFLPHAIRIGTLAGSASTSFNIRFNYIACMTDHQGEAIFNPAEADAPINTLASPPGPLMFNVVGFQGGVDPTSPFNGANAITPLANLSAADPFTGQYIQYSLSSILDQTQP